MKVKRRRAVPAGTVVAAKLPFITQRMIDGPISHHSHAGVAHFVGGVAVAQSYSGGRYFGRIDLTFHGNIALITPLTDVAQTWVSEHLEHEESLWWGPAIVVERRYLGPILVGMADDGLVITAE